MFRDSFCRYQRRTFESLCLSWVKVHGYEDTPEFREFIVKEFKEGKPCA
jgi:hypothetical protein